MANKRENKTRYAILGMLSFADKSAYEISKSIQNGTAHFWSESDGQLYPILKRLHEEGLVSYTAMETAQKRQKKIYSLTSDGQEALNDWLTKEPKTFTIRNEFLLQLFFGHNAKDEHNIEKITVYQGLLQKQLALYNNIEKQIKEKIGYPTYLLLSLSYGQYSIKAEIDWCSSAIKLLSERKQETTHKKIAARAKNLNLTQKKRRS